MTQQVLTLLLLPFGLAWGFFIGLWWASRQKTLSQHTVSVKLRDLKGAVDFNSYRVRRDENGKTILPVKSTLE